jgi:hypothetical protein
MKLPHPFCELPCRKCEADVVARHVDQLREAVARSYPAAAAIAKPRRGASISKVRGRAGHLEREAHDPTRVGIKPTTVEECRYMQHSGSKQLSLRVRAAKAPPRHDGCRLVRRR